MSDNILTRVSANQESRICREANTVGTGTRIITYGEADSRYVRRRFVEDTVLGVQEGEV